MQKGEQTPDNGTFRFATPAADRNPVGNPMTHGATQPMSQHPRGTLRKRSTSPSMEEYVETIAHLIADEQVTSVSDIARAAGVSRPAASRSIRDLTERGLVSHKSYGFVTLTPQGRALAQRLFARHDALFRLSRDILLLSPKDADEEACRLEHYVDDELARRIELLADFAGSHGEALADWRAYFLSRLNAPPSEDGNQPNPD